MAALKHMRRAIDGTIVQVGSALSYRAIPLQSAYCGAKFAIRGFTDALRSELKHDKSHIRLDHGATAGGQHAAIRLGPQSAARNACNPYRRSFSRKRSRTKSFRAAREAPRELWIGRSALKAIIGTMLLPRLGDRILAHEGYDGQMASKSAIPGRPDNLFQPVAGDPGARGRFSDRASNEVFGFNPAWLRAGAACLLLGMLAPPPLSESPNEPF